MSNIVPFSVPDDPRVSPGLELPRGSIVVYRGTSLQRGDGGPTDWAAPGATSEFTEPITVTATDTAARTRIASFSHRATGGSGSANDGGYIGFSQDNSVGEEIEFAQAGLVASNHNDSFERGLFNITVMDGGTLPDIQTSPTLSIRRSANRSILFTGLATGISLRGTENGQNIELAAGGGGSLTDTSGNVALSWNAGNQRVNFGLATVANGAGGVATLGTTGGSGPATTTQDSWLEISVGGVTKWVALWD